MVGQKVQAFFGDFALGDVGEDAGKVRVLTGFVFDAGDGQVFVKQRAVFAAVPQLALPEAVFAQADPQVAIKLGRLLAGGQNASVAADHFGLAIAGNARKRRVDGLDDAVGVGDHDAFQGGFKHLVGHAQVLPGNLQRFVALFQRVLQLVDVFVLDAGEDVRKTDHPNQLAAIQHAQVADVFFRQQLARVIQAGLLGHADDGMAGHRAHRQVRGFFRQQTHHVALGENAVITVRVAHQQRFDMLFAHQADGLVQRRIGRGHQRAALGVEDGVQVLEFEKELSALIQHDIALRQDAAITALIVHHQIMAHAMALEQHGGVVESGVHRDGFHRPAHHVAHRQLKGGGISKIQPQGVGFGPDAYRAGVFDHQQRAAGGLTHQAGSLNHTGFRLAGKNARGNDLLDGATDGHCRKLSK